MIFMIETQTRYLAQCIALRDKAGARSIGVPQQVQDEFNAELDEAQQAHGLGHRLPQLVPGPVRQQPRAVAGVHGERSGGAPGGSTRGTSSSTLSWAAASPPRRTEVSA